MSGIRHFPVFIRPAKTSRLLAHQLGAHIVRAAQSQCWNRDFVLHGRAKFVQCRVGFGRIKHGAVIGHRGGQYAGLTQALLDPCNVFAVFIARHRPVLPQVIDERHVIDQKRSFGQLSLLKNHQWNER